MADAEKKGLTVKIDADLHAEVRQYLEAHEMTMRAWQGEIGVAQTDDLCERVQRRNADGALGA